MDNSDSHPEEESFQEGDDEDEMDPEDKDEVEDPPEEDEDDPDFDPEMELDDYPKKTKAHCSICNLDFKTGRVYDLHRKIHTRSRGHKCKFCGSHFPSSDQRFRHANQAHLEEVKASWKECLHCHLYLPTEITLMKHTGICDSAKPGALEKATPENQAKMGYLEIEGQHCTLCVKDFPSINSLRTHVKNVHDLKLRFKCSYCSVNTLKDTAGVYKHVNDVHFDLISNSWRKCKFCSQYYPSLACLKRHVDTRHHYKTVHVPSSIRCCICPEIFTDEKSYQEHSRKDHPDYMDTDGLFCSICKVNMVSYLALQKHCLKDHQMKTRIKCSYCMLNFCNTSLFYKHANELHSDVIDGTWHKCSICQRFYPFAEVLKRHYESKHKNKMTDEERSEQPIETLKCSMCLKGFDEEKDYQEHLQKNHPEWMETDGTHCSICKRDFPSTLSLKMHAEREHFVRLRYKCPHCTESFNQQRPLYLHMNDQHTELIAKTWKKCNFCDQYLPTFVTLNKHVQASHKKETQSGSESEVKSFPCCICTKIFSSQNWLDEHTEEDHQDYMVTDGVLCTICDVDFKNTHVLTKHCMKVHGKKIRLRCQFCPQTFLLFSNFYKHANADHLELIKDTWIECKVCPQLVPNEDVYRRHYENAHGKALRKKIIQAPDNDGKDGFLETDGFHCSICNHAYKTTETLRAHTNRMHNLKIKIKCTFCPVTYADMLDYHKHAAKEHFDLVSKLWKKCQVCSKFFPSLPSLKKHCDKSHKNKSSNLVIFFCCYCQEVFDNQEQICRHKLEEHPEYLESDGHHCSVCDIYLDTEQELSEHCGTVHKMKLRISCDFCPETFSIKAKFHKHANDHHYAIISKEWLNCQHCTKLFPNKEVLEEHCGINHVEESEEASTAVVCAFCPVKFLSEDKYTQHLQESHSAEVEATWLKCKYCSKLCPDDASMRSHVTQSHKSAMTCNNCSETFEAMAELIEHVNEVHFTDFESAWIKCTECFKLFPSTYLMVLHSKKAHSVEKHPVVKHPIVKQTPPRPAPVKRTSIYDIDPQLQKKTIAVLVKVICQFCGMKCYGEPEMITHVNQKHRGLLSGKWSFCRVCNLYFPSAKSLNDHEINKHPVKARESNHVDRNVVKIGCNKYPDNVKKPMKCVFCTKVFKVQKPYFTHVNINHRQQASKEWLLCYGCSLYFPDYEVLRHHADLEHNTVFTGGAKKIYEKIQMNAVQPDMTDDEMIDGSGSNVVPETEFVAVNAPSTENVVVKIEPMQYLDETDALDPVGVPLKSSDKILTVKRKAEPILQSSPLAPAVKVGYSATKKPVIEVKQMRREITNPVKRFSPAVAAADTVKVIFNAGTNDQSEDFFEKAKEFPKATASTMVKLSFNNAIDECEAICKAEIKEEPMDFD